jgi:hypothetical protein
VQQDQTVWEMAEEVLDRQAKALARRSWLSLEDARRAVADTRAGRQLRDLTSGVWERAEERFMHQIGSEVLSRYAGEYPYSWLESYMERLEGKEARAR